MSVRHLRRWLPLVVSGGLLAALLAHLDVEAARTLLATADLRWVGAVLAVQVLDRLLMTWKWWLLLNARARHLSFGAAFKIYYISSFQGFLIPLGVGPDVVRFLKLRRHPIPTETVVASLVVERVLGLLATALLASVGLVLLLARAGERMPGWLVPLLLGVAALSVVTVLLVFQPAVRRRTARNRWVRRVQRRIPVASYLAAIGSYRENRALLARFGIYTLLEQFAYILTVYLAARALGIPLAFLDCVAFVPISTLLERLPLSVMGLGVREGSFAFLLMLLGVDYSSAIVLALFEFSVFVLTMVPAGFWAAWRPDRPPDAGRTQP